MAKCKHHYQLLKVEDDQFVSIKCDKCGHTVKHVKFLGLEFVRKGDIEE